MKNIYVNGEYAERIPDFHAKTSAWKSRRILELLKKHKLEPDTICEIGCGSGEILFELSKSLSEYTQFFGYDISPQAITLCKKKEKTNVSFYLKDFIEEDGVYYALLMCIDLIEHIEDYISFLKKIKDKGKYKIFHFPLDLSVQTVLRSSPLLQARKLVGHIHYFTKDTALAALQDAGYTIIDYSYTGSLLEVSHNNKYTKLLKIPRKLLFFLNKDLASRILGGWSLLVLTE